MPRGCATRDLPQEHALLVLSAAVIDLTARGDSGGAAGSDSRARCTSRSGDDHKQARLHEEGRNCRSGGRKRRLVVALEGIYLAVRCVVELLGRWRPVTIDGLTKRPREVARVLCGGGGDDEKKASFLTTRKIGYFG